MKKTTKPQKGIKSGTLLLSKSLQAAAAADLGGAKKSPVPRHKPDSKIPISHTPKLGHSATSLGLRSQPHPAAITGLTSQRLATFSSYIKPKSKFGQETGADLKLSLSEDRDLDYSAKSVQDDMSPLETNVIMEQIEQRDRELSRLRLENEVLKRRQFGRASGELTAEEREREDDKDELIKKLSKELTDLGIVHGELKFKYEGLRKEHESYEAFVTEKIGNTGDEVKTEVKAKEERIMELELEKGKMVETMTALRHKLNAAEEFKKDLEHERTELQKCRFMLDHEKSEVQKHKQAVEQGKGEMFKLTNQVKELIKQGEDYETKQRDAETQMQLKEDEMGRLQEEKDSMRQELDDWKELAEKYKKQLDETGAQQKQLQPSPTKTDKVVEAIKEPPTLVIDALQTNFKLIKDEIKSKGDAIKKEHTKELETLVAGQRSCLDNLAELSRMVRGLKEDISSHERKEPASVEAKKEESLAGTTLASNPFLESRTSVLMVDDFESQPPVEREPGTRTEQYANYLTTITSEKRQLETALEEERSKVLGLKVENKQLEKQVKQSRVKSGTDGHKRAWSTTYEGGVDVEMWQLRRRSFAKNLGIAWENMQILKETSTHVYAAFDQYFAQLK